MRKTLSLILSVMMLLSVCSFAIPASAAPEGTAINTADEFMAMAAEGKYYLNSDITLVATYPNAFNGTFDGNGHTVTVTNPMFNDFSGEVKNLTIKGDIVYVDANVAAFTVNSSKGFNATDCVNDVNITLSGTGMYVGGFVAYTEKTEGPCVFTNCVNNGDIYFTIGVDDYCSAGGIGAMVDKVTMINCTNNGDIYAKGHVGYIGGLIGCAAFTASASPAEAFNCVNNGKVTAEDTYVKTTGEATNGGSEAGGIFCEIGCKGNTGWYKVWGCVNNGKIDGTSFAAGMVAYTYGSGSNAFLDLQFCINTAEILYGRAGRKDDSSTHNDWASPFIAYTNSAVTTIKYNIDIGSLVRRDGAFTATPQTFFGLSSADATQYDLQHNYILNKDQFTHYSYASSDDNAGNRHEISETDGILSTTLEDVKSGKVANLINEAAANDPYASAAVMDSAALVNPGAAYFFYQKLGTADLPTASAAEIAGEWVILDGTAYKNGDKPSDDVTEPPVTTEAPVDTTAPEDDATEAPGDDATQAGGDATEAPADTTEPAKSGCGSVISGVVAIVAILGSALIIKKRD